MRGGECSVKLRVAAGVSGHQAAMLHLLMRRREVSRDALIEAMYGDRPDGGPEGADNVLTITILNLRRKLRKFGIEIVNLYGYGYAVSERDQKLLREMAED